MIWGIIWSVFEYIACRSYIYHFYLCMVALIQGPYVNNDKLKFQSIFQMLVYFKWLNLLHWGSGFESFIRHRCKSNLSSIEFSAYQIACRAFLFRPYSEACALPRCHGCTHFFLPFRKYFDLIYPQKIFRNKSIKHSFQIVKNDCKECSLHSLYLSVLKLFLISHSAHQVGHKINMN